MTAFGRFDVIAHVCDGVSFNEYQFKYCKNIAKSEK